MRDLTDCFLCPPVMECTGGTENNVTPCQAGSYCPGATWNSDSNPTAAISNKASCDSINFCDGGELSPITCPTGSLCQGNALTSSCNAGSFCYEGIEAECPAGGYCPIGTPQLIPYGRESTNGPLPKDPSVGGGTSESSYCDDCNEFFYCPGDGSQYLCEDGFICPRSTKYPTTFAMQVTSVSMAGSEYVLLENTNLDRAILTVPTTQPVYNVYQIHL